jgi:hypothetical protein
VLFYNEAIELVAYPVIQINREMKVKCIKKIYNKQNYMKHKIDYNILVSILAVPLSFVM